MRQKSFIVTVFFAIIALFIIAIVYLFTQPPSDITLKDITPAVAPYANPKESAKEETTLIDSLKTSVTEGNDKIKADYYIIVGSFKNLTQAEQKAEKLTHDLNSNITVLPATMDGYYRISCGKYSTLEEAKSTINRIRTNISPAAWILSTTK
jgi:cell division protein FtsN